MKPLTSTETQSDARLYIPFPEVWQAHVKTGWEKEYCYAKYPGEDFFHLILNGEIFVQNGDEKLCLTCAARQGVITTDRLNWQNKARSEQDPLI